MFRCDRCHEEIPTDFGLVHHCQVPRPIDNKGSLWGVWGAFFFFGGIVVVVALIWNGLQSL